MTARTTHSLIILAAVLVSGSCGDRGSTTQPMAAGGAAELSRAAPAPESSQRIVRILNRTVPLRVGVTASAIIGPAGGHLAIPEAGLTVEFAPRALSKPTRITISAIPGGGVAYEFQPHGVIFAAPVYVTQSLHNTAAEHDPALAAVLQGSYFDTELRNAFVDSTHTFARVKERRPAKLHTVRDLLEFTIEHFSGYMVSTGFAGSAVDIQVN